MKCYFLFVVTLSWTILIVAMVFKNSETGFFRNVTPLLNQTQLLNFTFYDFILLYFFYYEVTHVSELPLHPFKYKHFTEYFFSILFLPIDVSHYNDERSTDELNIDEVMVEDMTVRAS